MRFLALYFLMEILGKLNFYYDFKPQWKTKKYLEKEDDIWTPVMTINSPIRAINIYRQSNCAV